MMGLQTFRRSLLGLGFVLFIGALVGVIWPAGCVEEPRLSESKHVEYKRLTILTPHNENIRTAFEDGFSEWYRKKHQGDGTPTEVDITWIVEGTPKCVEYIENYYTQRADVAPRRAPDLMFGGGVSDHRLLAERGHATGMASLAEFQDMMPDRIGSFPTCDEQLRWVATGCSSFGILYNRRSCEARGIAPPASWEDLADPRFFSWMAVGEPASSGSNRQCMMLILQQHGWEKGWSIIMRILGNSRALANRSSVALDQVRSGVSLAAFAVNFDGLTRVEASDGALAYLNPPEGTAVTPDVMSRLECATEPELAEEFAYYVLSEDGQALWSVSAEKRATFAATLYHYPIRKDIYEKYADSLSVPENPVDHHFGQTIQLEQSRGQGRALAPLVRAACGENHLLLQQVWQEIIDAGLPPAALAELTSPPFDEDHALQIGTKFQNADSFEAIQMMQEWSKVFRDKYERARSLIGGA